MFFMLRLFAGFTGFTLIRCAWEQIQLDGPGIKSNLAKCSPERLQWLYDTADEETRVVIKSFM